jgi:hypothetical protein
LIKAHGYHGVIDQQYPALADIDQEDTNVSSIETHTGKRKLSAATADSHGSMPRNIRKSAWPNPRPKAKFVRDPLMVPCTFIRSVAEVLGPSVIFSSSELTETIYLAGDWKDGWEKSLRKEEYGDSGYIGKGSAKRVIYVYLTVHPFPIHFSL